MKTQAVFAFSLAATAVAWAGDDAGKFKGRMSESLGSAQPAKTFQQLDQNRDGAVSRDEALPAGSLLTRFSELDRDHDGVLSSDEFAAFESGPARPAEKPAVKKDPVDPAR